MRSKIAVLACSVAGVLAMGALAPAANVGSTVGDAIGVASAEAAPKGGGGQFQSGKKLGDNTSKLIRNIIGPLLLVVLGVVVLAQFKERDFGKAVGVVLIGMLAGFFLFAPEQAETTFKSIYQAIF